MNRFVTDRNRQVVSGGIGIVVLVALITLGIKAAFGAYDDHYRIQGSFAAAGQGLIEGSDVKIRGLDIGEVASIELEENRALITLDIEPERDIPVDAEAVIRPKTLFGEKFVDILPGENELTGPYLASAPVDDACPDPEIPCITNTLGGFELERVLADTYPILQAIDPAELAVVLDELAKAGDGLGPTINRSIVNASTLAELGVSNDAEFRQLTADLALLSEELEQIAPELRRGAENLNAALPSLNARRDQLNAALVQLGRLSGDVADLLDNNRSFTENALTNGARSVEVLHRHRGQLQPLLVGIEQYTSTLAEAIRIEVGDGTMMAAIKNLVSVSEMAGGAESSGTASPPPTTAPPPPAPTNPLEEDVEDTIEDATDSTDELLDLLTGGGS